METLKTFAEKLHSDPDLVKKLESLGDENDVIALMKANGVSDTGIEHIRAHVTEQAQEADKTDNQS